MSDLVYSKLRLLHKSIIFPAAILILVMLSACAGKGNYGTLEYDNGLDDQFTSYRILPDHNYYITASYSAPAAILAIHKDYQLADDASMWMPVPDVSPAHMQNWIDNLSSGIGSSGMNFWKERPFMAFRILDPDGKMVGAWYSAQRNTPVEFLEGNRIVVFVPHLKPAFGGEEKKMSKP